jgi:hypothetical protein
MFQREPTRVFCRLMNCLLSSTKCIPKWVVRRFRRSSCCALCCCRCCTLPWRHQFPLSQRRLRRHIVRSERMPIEETDYNILFRWFVGLNLDDAIWDATVFTKNRDRLTDCWEAEVAKDFLPLAVEQARGQGSASDEHFTVDPSLLAAWASAKSFQPKNKKGSPPPDDPGNLTLDYRGALERNARVEKRSRSADGAQRRGQGG